GPAHPGPTSRSLDGWRSGAPAPPPPAAGERRSSRRRPRSVSRGRLGLPDRRRPDPTVLADVDGHAVGAGELALEILRADGYVGLALRAVLTQDAVKSVGVVHAEAEVVQAHLHLAGLLVLDAQYGKVDVAVG